MPVKSIVKFQENDPFEKNSPFWFSSSSGDVILVIILDS